MRGLSMLGRKLRDDAARARASDFARAPGDSKSVVISVAEEQREAAHHLDADARGTSSPRPAAIAVTALVTASMPLAQLRATVRRRARPRERRRAMPITRPTFAWSCGGPAQPAITSSIDRGVDAGAREELARDERAEVAGVLALEGAAGFRPRSAHAGGEDDRCVAQGCPRRERVVCARGWLVVGLMRRRGRCFRTFILSGAGRRSASPSARSPSRGTRASRPARSSSTRFGATSVARAELAARIFFSNASCVGAGARRRRAPRTRRARAGRRSSSRARPATPRRPRGSRARCRSCDRSTSVPLIFVRLSACWLARAPQLASAMRGTRAAAVAGTAPTSCRRPRGRPCGSGRRRVPCPAIGV